MSFSKGLNANTITYPLTQDQIDNLSNSSLASPMVGNANGLKNVISEQDINELADEVVKVRLDVQRGEYPQWFIDKYYPFKGSAPTQLTKPLLNERLRKSKPNGLADVVHMDLPLDMPNAVLKWLVKEEGAKLIDEDTDFINFTNKIFDMTSYLAEGASEYGRQGFEVKYNYGVERPEEVSAFGIDVTHYPEGCPTHPSYPAGHGAVAGGGVLPLLEKFDLTDAQKKVILDTAYLWSMFRTFAGVHYGDDNVAGMWLSLKDYFTEEKRNYYSL